jgi:hypothetical protein
VMKPQRPLQRQVHLRGRPASKPTVIRGITYYKAKVSEEENDIEEQREFGLVRLSRGRAGRESPSEPPGDGLSRRRTPYPRPDYC